jgi:glucose/arabinose dehydrogenase
MRATGAVAFLMTLVAAACAASSGTSAVAPPRLSAAPGALEPDAVWQARLTATGGPRLVVSASDGTQTLRFGATRRSRGTYAVRFSFPHTGAWRLAAVVAGRRHALRTVRVTLEVAEAYKVVVDRDGTLLVADANHGSGRVVRIDLATGRRSVAVRPGGRVYSVAVAPDGLLYVVAANRVWRIEPSGRRTLVAGSGGGGSGGDGGPATAAGLGDAFAVAPAPGRLYVSQQTSPRLRVVDLASGTIRSFASGFDQPLGMTTLADGRLLVADSHHGAIVALTPDGAASTFHAGATLPVDVSPGRDGSVLIVDHVAHDAPGRILRRGADGRVGVISEGRAIALTSVAEAPDGTLYATSFDPRYPVGVLDPATGDLRPLPR